MQHLPTDLTALNAVPEAILLVGREGDVLYANHSAATMFGLSRATLMDMMVDQLVPAAQRMAHSAHREEFQSLLTAEHAMGNGRPVYARHSEGHHIPITVTLRVCSWKDEPTTLCAVRDISRLIADQDKLRTQSAALEATADGVVITDADGRIEWANAAFCALSGYQFNELDGKSTALLRSGVHSDAFYAELWETIKRGDTWRGEIVNRKKDGHLYTEQQTITPVADHKGDINQFVAIKRDVTDRKQSQYRLQQQLRQAEVLNRVATLANKAHEVLVFVDAVLEIIGEELFLDRTFALVQLTDGRDAVARGWGYPPGNLVHPTIASTVVTSNRTLELPAAGASPESSLSKGMQSGIALPMRAQRFQGALVLKSRRPVSFDELGRRFLNTLARQITNAIERLLLFDEVQALAATDPLTGIFNRRRFQELGERELARSKRSGRPLSAVLIDVDHFKEINDSHGHEVGDQALERLSETLVGGLRTTDVIGRLGGEEFAILMPETGADGAREVADRLLERVAKIMFPGVDGLSMTISAGVAEYTTPEALSGLIRRADQAMYQAKDLGRNRVEIWSASDVPQSTPVSPQSAPELPHSAPELPHSASELTEERVPEP